MGLADDDPDAMLGNGRLEAVTANHSVLRWPSGKDLRFMAPCGGSVPLVRPEHPQLRGIGSNDGP